MSELITCPERLVARRSFDFDPFLPRGRTIPLRLTQVSIKPRKMHSSSSAVHWRRPAELGQIYPPSSHKWYSSNWNAPDITDAVQPLWADSGTNQGGRIESLLKIVSGWRCHTLWYFIFLKCFVRSSMAMIRRQRQAFANVQNHEFTSKLRGVGLLFGQISMSST